MTARPGIDTASAPRGGRWTQCARGQACGAAARRSLARPARTQHRRGRGPSRRPAASAARRRPERMRPVMPVPAPARQWSCAWTAAGASAPRGRRREALPSSSSADAAQPTGSAATHAASAARPSQPSRRRARRPTSATVPLADAQRPRDRSVRPPPRDQPGDLRLTRRQRAPLGAGPTAPLGLVPHVPLLLIHRPVRRAHAVRRAHDPDNSSVLPTLYARLIRSILPVGTGGAGGV